MSLNKGYNGSMFYSNNYWNSVNKKMMVYEEELEKKEKLINQLKEVLKKEKNKSKSYEIKFDNINSQYTRFQESKEKLSTAVKLLKENLASYENKIEELQQENSAKISEVQYLRDNISRLEVSSLDKDNTITSLNEIIAEKETTISFLSKEIDTLQDEIKALVSKVDNLSDQLNEANSKSASSILTKFFSSK